MEVSRRKGPLLLREGEVTALVARRGRGERVAVHLDGRRAFDLAVEVADRAGLRAGAILTVEQQEDLIEQDGPYRAREQALRLLSVRDRSVREVETRLHREGFHADEVGSTVEWLVRLGYLDDRRFAAAYAAEKERSGWGPRKIRGELVGRGVERPVVEEVLAACKGASRAAEDAEDRLPEDHALPDALEKTIRRRFGGEFLSDPQGAQRRLSGFLARRGYDWDTIDRVVAQMRRETDSEPESPSIP